MSAFSPRGARPRLAPAIEAAILGLGLASSAGVALAGGCAASRDMAEPAAAMRLSEELGRRYRWQPGVCRYVEPAEAEAPQPEQSSRAAALALKQIRSGTGH